jgi:hypothetical protein
VGLTALLMKFKSKQQRLYNLKKRKNGGAINIASWAKGQNSNGLIYM